MARNHGKVRSRTRHGQRIYYLDFRPIGEVYSIPSPAGGTPMPFSGEEMARSALESIRDAVAEGKTLTQALAPWLSRTAPEYLVVNRAQRWLQLMAEKVERGDRSPTYLRELQRYMHPEKYLAYWENVSIFEVRFGHLEDWLTWLSTEKRLSASTRKKVLDAFRVFLRWLRKRGDIDSVPEFPEVPVDEYSPTIISVEKQAAVIDAIPWERRGAFMAARLGVRPGEIRAFNVDDYDPPWLRISKAAKGPNANAPIRGTKSRASRRIRVDEELADWLEWRTARITPQDLLRGPLPLFQNPTGRRDRKRWLGNALRLEWNRACERIGIRVKMYEGTKHSSASAAVQAGESLYRVQQALGHSDSRSTERYAKLTDESAAEVFHLSPRRPKQR